MLTRDIYIAKAKIHKSTLNQHVTSQCILTKQLDCVVTEEPLQVILKSYTDTKIQKTTVMTTMRTPGHDIELVRGWLNTQCFITLPQVHSITKTTANNVVIINAHHAFRLDHKQLTRLAPTTSSCGICGDAEIEKITVQSKVKAIVNISIDQKSIDKMIERAFESAPLFQSTGGSHASASYQIENNKVTPILINIREDVGRHNALDKLIGSYDAHVDELYNTALLLSGRVSADLMQKVICAGIPLVISLGSPSNLAIELAESCGIILLGFVKKDSFNVYAGLKQITVSDANAVCASLSNINDDT